jgi:hypothetical protein
MGAQGTATLDFGAYPGTSITSVAVTGQTGIVSSSLIEAWIRPIDTANHTADEHLVDPPRVLAGNIIAGTGFTIYGIDQNGVPVPDALECSGGRNIVALEEQGRKAPMPQGQWSVAWVWN